MRRCLAASLPLHFRLILLLTASLFVAPPPPARADSFARREAHFASHLGNQLYLSLGVALPLLTDGAAGKTQALRTADALVVSTLLTHGLKTVTREKRPDSDERNSFPSGHASAAFTVATMQSHYHPKQAPLWFLGAGLIAESRVRLRRHYVHDVLAGAALGYASARWQLSRPRGLVLAPLIPSPEGGVGLQVSGQF